MYFIGNFTYLTDQQESTEGERRHGHFSMMVETVDSHKAMALFRQRLIRFRESSSFFSGKCTIYVTQLLEFEQFPKREAVLLNFKSYAGDPVMPFISCTIPSEQSDACHIHEWDNNHPLTEGRPDSLFLEFGDSQNSENL